MKSKHLKHAITPLLRIALSASLALVIVLAAIPQPAQAAQVCQTYYTVREGDTTPFIAHTFNLKWRDIANANDMKVGERPVTGQYLCIPPETVSTRVQVQPEGDQRAVISATISGSRIYLSLSKFKGEHVYLVKARSADQSVGGWYKLGKTTVEKNKTYNLSWTIPSDLSNVHVISVCLKDMMTDELICQNVINP
jgi:hypothetical protein